MLSKFVFPLSANISLDICYFDDDKDSVNLFMVMDLMLGGDLRFHLERINGSMSEARVQFYVAELGLALNYLHEKNIVHRSVSLAIADFWFMFY